MKKLLFLTLALLCALTFAACGKAEPSETAAPTAAETTATTAPKAVYPIPGEADKPVSIPEVDWGLTVTTENLRLSGATLLYTQSGGNPTGELQTGSYFTLEVFDGEWTEAEMLPQEFEIAWNALAYLINMNDTTEMAEDWSYLYGPLDPGCYRLGKEVMDFRSAGDYDEAMFYAYFEITE